MNSFGREAQRQSLCAGEQYITFFSCLFSPLLLLCVLGEILLRLIPDLDGCLRWNVLVGLMPSSSSALHHHTLCTHKKKVATLQNSAAKVTHLNTFVDLANCRSSRDVIILGMTLRYAIPLYVHYE